VEVRRGRSRSGVLGGELDREVVKHGLNVVFHMDADLAAVAEIEVHCKAVMEIATFLFYFATMATHGVEPVCELVINESGKVACHDVVDMEANGVLFAVKHLVGNTLGS